MPAFADSDAGHQTIAGPDNWVVFDNGYERKQAAVDFVRWLTAADQVRTTSLATGDLPIRESVGRTASFRQQLDQNLPGSSTFVKNLSNVKKARPAVEQYPAISEAMGQAIVVGAAREGAAGRRSRRGRPGDERRVERRLGPVVRQVAGQVQAGWQARTSRLPHPHRRGGDPGGGGAWAARRARRAGCW